MNEWRIEFVKEYKGLGMPKYCVLWGVEILVSLSY